MKLECHLQVELPFVLNLPTCTMTVDVGEQLELGVDNEVYLVNFWNGHDQRSIVTLIGGLSEISQRLGIEKNLLQSSKLRTVVKHRFAQDLQEADLKALSDEEVIQTAQAEIIKASASMSLDSDKLLEQAKAEVASMDEASLRVFKLRERQRRHAHAVSARVLPLFQRAVNRLVRWYSIVANDFFVEEVGLHQLSATATRGVLHTTYVDGIQIETSHFVGKIPPLIRTPWMPVSPSAVAELDSKLRSPDDPDFAMVLAMRARHLLERTAFRNAISEAAASLEVAVARSIRSAMTAAGKSQTEVDSELDNTNMNFPARAETTLKTWCGKGLQDLDDALWTSVKDDRKHFRNAVVHSDREPSQQDAEVVVERFLKMTMLVQQHCK